MDEHLVPLEEILAGPCETAGAAVSPDDPRPWPKPDDLPKGQPPSSVGGTVYLPWQLAKVVVGELRLMGIPAKVAEDYTDDATEDHKAARIVDRLPAMGRFSPIIVETVTTGADQELVDRICTAIVEDPDCLAWVEAAYPGPRKVDAGTAAAEEPGGVDRL